MCVVATGAPKGKEAEFALAYCSKNHKVGAPQHALVAKRTEFLAALDSTMAQKRPRLRQGAVKAGKVVGKRPEESRGVFPGRRRALERESSVTTSCSCTA